MRSRFAVLVALSVCLLTSKSFADFMEAGPPPEGGSWSVGFTNDSGLAFSIIIIHYVSGALFEGPGLSALSTSSWDTAIGGGVLAVAYDPTLGAEPWIGGEVTIHFEGNMIGSPATFAIFGLSSNFTPLDATLVEWDGFSFSYSPYSGGLPSGWESLMGGAVVPLPAPVALGAVGLLGVVVGRKRLRRAIGA